MPIKKITIAFSTKSKSKLETLMFNTIEKLLKYFVRLWEVTLGSDLPSKDKVKILLFLIIGFVLVYMSQAALFVWVLDKAK